MNFLTTEERIGILYNEFLNIKLFIIELNKDFDDFNDEELGRRFNRVIAHVDMYLEEQKKQKHQAQALFNYNTISFAVGVFNFDIALIFHELTHLIVYYLSIANKHNPIKEHVLEFAIVNYVLYYRYTKNSYFFKYYDIHEEEHIAKMNINIFNFVKFIQRLKFKNINDLYLKAHAYANKVRQKTKKL
ncbi:hypothetical protein [Enterobacter roggenkampii]|uniref:hypothetical protein n=1 Tax=Enterobacter roggenkampii TaxID=1812935 RepID=UPI00403F23ED